jgi:hypothetical protein
MPANKIEKASTEARIFVDITSRYVNSQVLYYSENNILTFETYKRKPKQLSGNDRFMVVTKNLEFRPDLISKMAYGFTSYWWKIMEFNDIKDIYDFKAGLNIRIPESVF